MNDTLPENGRDDVVVERQKIAIVTGANTGIGEVTARVLAACGMRVFLACRNPEKAEAARARIVVAVPDARVEVHPLDLSSLVATRRSAEAFLAKGLPLDVLVNNAGMAGQRGTTIDGFELHFGVNHLAPFLFTRLLEAALKQAGAARIVNVASRAHFQVKKGIDWEALRKPTRSLTGLPEYAVSKLCNVLGSREHARRLQGTGVHTYALHPGVVASDVWRNVPWPFREIIKHWMISNEEGARTTVYCATSPDVAMDTGYYYDTLRVVPTSPLGADDTLARELWQRCAAWTGVDG